MTTPPPTTPTLINVAKYCRSQLNERALSYLYDERGLTRRSIDEWLLGYCPFETDGLMRCASLQGLLEHKILFKNRREGDYFTLIRNSIIFPFVDQYGNVVAISSRPLQSNEVIKERNLKKYWHTSFGKAWFLYGLYRALPAIREQDVAIVGEGQFDVITAHQHGITNAVGVCGTALTARHISILSRFAGTVIMAYDADEAGQKSLDKIRKREQLGTAFKAVRFPPGEDMDSYIRTFGRQSFLDLIATAQ